MRNTITTFVISLLAIMPAMAQNCRGPMDMRSFGMSLQQLKTMPKEDLRFNRATTLVTTNCLSSAQAFEVGLLFVDDEWKYDLMAAAYPNVTDPQNAYVLLDVFSTFSGAFRLYDYINFIDRERNRPGRRPRTPMPVPADPVPVPLPTPPPVPVCTVTEADMRDIRSAIQAEFTTRGAVDQGKLVIRAKQCLSADQIVSIIPLFSTTSAQLEMAKFAFDYCIDQQNYFKVVNVMGTTSAKDDLRRYLESRR